MNPQLRAILNFYERKINSVPAALREDWFAQWSSFIEHMFTVQYVQMENLPAYIQQRVYNELVKVFAHEFEESYLYGYPMDLVKNPREKNLRYVYYTNLSAKHVANAKKEAQEKNAKDYSRYKKDVNEENELYTGGNGEGNGGGGSKTASLVLPIGLLLMLLDF